MPFKINRLWKIAHRLELRSTLNLDGGDAIPEGMAHPGVETSNALFEELADWEHQLKHLDTDLLEPEPPSPEEPLFSPGATNRAAQNRPLHLPPFPLLLWKGLKRLFNKLFSL